MNSRNIIGYVLLCLENSPEGYSDYKKGNYFSVEGCVDTVERATVFRNSESRIVDGFCKVPLHIDLHSLEVQRMFLLSDSFSDGI